MSERRVTHGEFLALAPPRARSLARRSSPVAASTPAADGLRLRPLAVRAHRYVGLCLSVFLVVAGVTGSALTFKDEIDAALNPTLWTAVAPTPHARPLDPFELQARLRAALPPGTRVDDVPLARDPGHNAQFFVQPAPGAARADDTYFVDPYTGAVVGSRRYGDLTAGVENLMPFVLRLHTSLALGRVGEVLLGLVALLWAFDCFVGAYLTLPSRRRSGRPTGTRSWWGRWRSSWLVRAGRLFGVVFSWHRASGLWAWGLLLAFAWSAVGLNLAEVHDPVMAAAFGRDPAVYHALPTPPSPRYAPGLDAREAARIGSAHMACEAEARGFAIRRQTRLSYRPSVGAYRYVVESSRDVSSRHADTALWLDGETGALLGFEAPTGARLGDAVDAWLVNLHRASLARGGAAYRGLVALLGLAVAGLSVSGVCIWWRKRRRPERAA